MNEGMQLKAYTLVSRYMQGVQAGIQGAHSFVELANWRTKSSCYNPMKCTIYDEWATKHKTMVFLSNGGKGQMGYVYDLLRDRENQHFPYGAFYETDLGESKVMTAITVVMPNAKTLQEKIDEETLTCYNDVEERLIDHIAGLRTI